MPFEPIARAQQRCRQRLAQAFDAFCGDDARQSRLELREPEQLPSHERVRLPYEDGEFDWVACHELIETYGSHERQVRLLRELLRIARRGIFVSTPNRGHPLASWMYPERQAKLHDALTIKTMVDVLPGRPVWKLGHVRLAGFKSHYFLMVWKDAAAHPAQHAGPAPQADRPPGEAEPPAAAWRPR